MKTSTVSGRGTRRPVARPRPSSWEDGWNSGNASAALTAPAGRPVTATFPTVSVIIPCKNNAGTIRATVGSLLRQDCPALEEVILVGSTGDSTWTALTDIIDPRLILLEQESTPGQREPNNKRDKGLRKARGEILALADSDIVMDPDWLSLAIPRLIALGGGVIARGVKTIHDTFWGRFVDRNVLAAKTPRVPNSYLVTARNFGHRHTRPPVTANAVFTRELYETCPLNVAWGYGYKNYEWFWRVARAGHRIVVAGDINGACHRRRRFRDLATEYRHSAEGCSHFIWCHPDSPLGAKRRRQAIILPVVAAAGVLAADLLASAGMFLPMTAVIALVAVVLMGREIIAARRLEAAVYPYTGWRSAWCSPGPSPLAFSEGAS
jgi:glycosyltransferase involved in cell wall biosynthesis